MTSRGLWSRGWNLVAWRPQPRPWVWFFGKLPGAHDDATQLSSHPIRVGPAPSRRPSTNSMSAQTIAQARLHRRSQQQPPIPADTSTAPRVCRYCDQPERLGSPEGELIVPCHCQGNLRYVHLACLRKHQYAAARKGGGMHCEVCKARYFVGYPQASEAAQAAMSVPNPGNIKLNRTQTPATGLLT